MVGTSFTGSYTVQMWTNAVYISTNSGADWVLTGTLPLPFNAGRPGQIAMTADGSRLAIATHTMSIDISTNFGLGWSTAYPSSEPMYHQFVATSGEGSALIVLSAPTNSSLPARIFMSSDWGATWRPVGSVTNYLQNYSAACSADGVTIAVAESTLAGTSTFPDGITFLLLSTDSGASWSTQVVDFTNQCSVVSSADGSRLAVALGPSGFYVRQLTPVPLLKILSAPGSLALSWLLPSEPFVLEESPDLLTWSQVDTIPTLNYTNLRYVGNVRASIVPKFYRLISQ